MIKVREVGAYDEMLEDLLFDYPDLESVIEQRIIWFKNNPNDTRLENHPLTKRLEGKWAFSITNDVRILYKWLGKTTARFLAIGGHKKVYKRENK